MAQAVKPAEPRLDSSRLSSFFYETLPYPQPFNEPWINCGADFPTYGQASAFWMDRYLDSASGGPRHLKQPNHVHLRVLARVSPSRFLQL